jgi:hypothetical protein
MVNKINSNSDISSNQPLTRESYLTEEKIRDNYSTSGCGPADILSAIACADPRFVKLDLKNTHHAEEGPLSAKSMQKLGQKKHIVDDLVGLTPRDANFVYHGPKSRQTTYSQRFGHIESRSIKGQQRLYVVSDQTLSSNAIMREGKTKNSYMRHYNANLAVVRRKVAGESEGQLLAVRSARPDTPERIEELLVYGAASVGSKQLQVDTKKATPRLVYRPVILSAMDLSQKKALWGAILRFFGKPGYQEKVYLRNQQRAIDKLFGSKKSIERTVGGKTFLIMRPLVYNLPLSSQARSPKQILAARKRNLPATQQLFRQLAQHWSKPKLPKSPAMRDLIGSMQNYTQLADMQAFLKLQQLDPEGVEALWPQERMALQALATGLLNQDLAGKPQLGPLATGYELLHLQQAFAALGMMPHVSCKSGLDRTAAGIGILMMGDMVGRTAEGPFEPLNPQTTAEQQLAAKEVFTKSVDSFGKGSFLKLVRGHGTRGKLKLQLGRRHAHPFAESFLLADEKISLKN